MDPVHSTIRLAYAALAVVAGSLPANAEESRDDADPCTDAVAAFVSRGGEECFVTSPVDLAQPRDVLAKGYALSAGDEIECAAGASVTITFCASREDKVIAGDDSPYIVPNVPNKERKEEQRQLASAIRSARDEASNSEPRALERVAYEEPSPLPTCERKLGTIAIVEPEKNWWRSYNLESPQALIKLYAQRSGCFTIVERGNGLASMQRDSAPATIGEVSSGSSSGKR